MENRIMLGLQGGRRAWPPRVLAFTMTVALAACLTACGEPRDGTPADDVGSREAALVVGQCTRDPVVVAGLKTSLRACTIDTDCPCGSFCDGATNVCAYQCNVPPAGPAETCAAGTQCDDTGRCASTTPSPFPAAPAEVLSSVPTVTTRAGATAAATFKVILRAKPETSADVATKVRVIGRDGAQVACSTALTFGNECLLDGGWTFATALDGIRREAAKDVWVKTQSGTADGRGVVILRIDATDREYVVATPATTPAATLSGYYKGTATSAGFPDGISVTAYLFDGDHVLVRDPSLALTSDGWLWLDHRKTSGTVAVTRKVVWLRGVAAAPTDGAIVGQYAAGVSTVDAASGEVIVPYVMQLPGGDVAWSIRLKLVPGPAPAPTCPATPCAGGDLCAAGGVCIPATVPGGVTTAFGNQLDDARSASFWALISPQLATTNAASAFGTNGANLVETLLCTVKETAAQAGSFATGLAMQGTVGASRSGDLACATGGVADYTAPGPVGLITYRDRVGDPVATDQPRSGESLILFNQCMAELKQTASSFFNFDPTFGTGVGQCVNLARALPALRLMATGEVNKGTLYSKETRIQGLFVRLVAQWATLQGFVASVGMAARDFNDGTSAVLDPAQALADLNDLMDESDRGWTALLDRRIAPAVMASANWRAGGAADPSPPDYRRLRAPLVYWPFNSSHPIWPPGVDPEAARDVVRGVTLALNTGGTFAATPPTEPCVRDGCPPPEPMPEPEPVPEPEPDEPPYDGASTLGWNNVLYQDLLNQPGFRAQLPADAPSLSEAGRGNITVAFSQKSKYLPSADWSGGILATETLAVADTTNAYFGRIVVAHPSVSAGGPFTVIVKFENIGISTGETLNVITRDTTKRKYYLYQFNAMNYPGLRVFEKEYWGDVSGRLDFVPARNIFVGRTPAVAATHLWYPYGQRPWQGTIDDLTIYDSALSAREAAALGQVWSSYPNHRDLRLLWSDLVLPTYPSQDVVAPLGAQLLESEAAHLELAAGLLAHVRYDAAAVCQGSTAAAASVEAALARAGRTLRESSLVEVMTAGDTTDRAGKARELLAAKRAKVLDLSKSFKTCADPYGLGSNEVPLYFKNLDPLNAPKASYFAVSTYMVEQALEAASTAKTAFEAARSAWLAARQSQIQEVLSQTDSAKHILALKQQYGSVLQTLCGSELSAEQLVDAAATQAGFLDRCFVKSTAACLAQHNTGDLKNLDPSCYRGAIGRSLMEARAAQLQMEGAYQTWQGTRSNSDAAERLCILREIDFLGCSVADRYNLTGAWLGQACSEPWQGTRQLVDRFHHKANVIGLITGAVGGLVGVGQSFMSTSIATRGGPGGGGGAGAPAAQLAHSAGAAAALAGIQSGVNLLNSLVESWRQDMQAQIDVRNQDAELRQCWFQADQLSTAMDSAQSQSKTAAAQFAAAVTAYENAVNQARAAATEGVQEVNRELTRPTIPIAFHYWLPEKLTTFRTAMERARRYTYLALRATEHDTQHVYADSADATRPHRSGVVGAWNPQTLLDELTLMNAETGNGTVGGSSPSLNQLYFDVGQKFLGIVKPTPAPATWYGDRLLARVRPVYDRSNRYLGEGVTFTVAPPPVDTDASYPPDRCAERIWKVNVGMEGWPTTGLPSNYMLKVLKKDEFASRVCDAGGLLKYVTQRPELNFFVNGSDPPGPTFRTEALLPVFNFTGTGGYTDYTDVVKGLVGASDELAMKGLYGEYVILFPKETIANAGGVANLIRPLKDMIIRFDYLSAGDANALGSPSVELDDGDQPIVVSP